MNEMQTNRIREIIADETGAELDQVTREAGLVTDLGADSIEKIEIVMRLEEEFSVEIPDEAAESIHTVGDALDWLETHVETQTPVK